MAQVIVWVGLPSAGSQIVKEQSFGTIRPGRVPLIFAFCVGDHLPVRAPTRLSGVVGDLHAAAPIHIHVVHVSNLALARSLVNNETDLRPIGRGMGIHLIDVRRPGQVGFIRTVCMDEIQLPVVLTVRLPVGFIDDLERNRCEVELGFVARLLRQLRFSGRLGCRRGPDE